MKSLYRIEVTSTRSLFGLDLFPPEEWDGEDFFFEEEEEDVFPSDRWESPIEPPSLPPSASTTLTSYGLFKQEEDGSFRISYEDTEITGLQGCLTTFCLAPTGMLIMLRRGSVKTCMVFEEGHRHLCDYGASGGAPSVTLHTHLLTSTLTPEGGTLTVEYSVEMRGSRTERNRLHIVVK